MSLNHELNTIYFAEDYVPDSKYSILMWFPSSLHSVARNSLPHQKKTKKQNR